MFFTKKDCLRLFLKERWNDPLAMILGETVWGQVFGTNLGRNWGEVIWAMPKRKQFFLCEVFP